MSELLYRGVNEEQFQSLLSLKKLEPKGDTFSTVLLANGDFKFDGSITFGASQQNSIAGHQKNSDRYKTSGISTTPHWHRAAFYALNGLKNSSGYVLVFEKATLIETGITLHVVKDHIPLPEIAEDSEVILVSKDNKPISIDSIKRIEKVERNIIWAKH